MDLDEFWQENKRFVLTVAAGAIVFLIGLAVIDGTIREDVMVYRRSVATNKRNLQRPLFKGRHLDRAKEQNRALNDVLVALRGQVEFQPREEFQVDGRAGSVSNTYFAVASAVRENLLMLAGRANVRLPESLGLPPSVVDEDEIVRYLEGLDVVDRVVQLGLTAGVERFVGIDIKLDPALVAKKPMPPIEETEVAFELVGTPGPLVQLVALTQEERFGQSLLVRDVEIKSAKVKRDEVRLKMTLVLCHLHGQGEGEDPS